MSFIRLKYGYKCKAFELEGPGEEILEVELCKQIISDDIVEPVVLHSCNNNNIKYICTLLDISVHLNICL